MTNHLIFAKNKQFLFPQKAKLDAPRGWNLISLNFFSGKKIFIKKCFDPVAETHETKWELLNMSVITNEIMEYAITRQQLLLNWLALKICLSSKREN